jgi:hypothetical protein
MPGTSTEQSTKKDQAGSCGSHTAGFARGAQQPRSGHFEASSYLPTEGAGGTLL